MPTCRRCRRQTCAAATRAFAAGCGGAPSDHGVARFGPTTTAARGAGPPAGTAATSRLLAYASCMRSHGVPGFPDPAGGNLPKPQVVTARQQDPSRFDAAAGEEVIAPYGIEHGGAGEQIDVHPLGAGDIDGDLAGVFRR